MSLIPVIKAMSRRGGTAGGGTLPGDTTAPTVVSATTPSGAPDTVVLVFSEAVNFTSAGWSFKKNGAAWVIDSFLGSGTTWTLTMTTAAVNGDILLRSYNAATGATTDTASPTNELASFTDQPVTNNVPGVGDTTAPIVVSRTAITSTTIRVVYSEAVNASVAGHSFNNGSALAPTAATGVNSTTVDYTVSGLASGQTITHTMSAPSYRRHVPS